MQKFGIVGENSCTKETHTLTHTHSLGWAELAVLCDLSFVSVFRGVGNSEVGVREGCEHSGDTLANEVAEQEL